MNRRTLTLLMGALLAASLFGASIAVAQSGRQPGADLGTPAQGISHKWEIMPIDQVRTQIDYPLLTPASLPAGVRLVGASFAAPDMATLYPNAPADARADFNQRGRLRPVSLLYEGPDGAFTMTATAVGVGVSSTVEGTTPRPKGIEQAGEVKVANGLEYAVRTVSGQRLIPGETRFPETTLRFITWQAAAGKQLTGSHSSLRLYDFQWTIAGTLPEAELVEIARGAR